jgi:hypothetical protein
VQAAVQAAMQQLAGLPAPEPVATIAPGLGPTPPNTAVPAALPAWTYYPDVPPPAPPPAPPLHANPTAANPTADTDVPAPDDLARFLAQKERQVAESAAMRAQVRAEFQERIDRDIPIRVNPALAAMHGVTIPARTAALPMAAPKHPAAPKSPFAPGTHWCVPVNKPKSQFTDRVTTPLPKPRVPQGKQVGEQVTTTKAVSKKAAAKGKKAAAAAAANDSSDDEAAHASSSCAKKKTKAKPTTAATPATPPPFSDCPAFHATKVLCFNPDLFRVGQPVAVFYPPKEGIEPSGEDWWTGHIHSVLKTEKAWVLCTGEKFAEKFALPAALYDTRWCFIEAEPELVSVGIRLGFGLRLRLRLRLSLSSPLTLSSPLSSPQEEQEELELSSSLSSSGEDDSSSDSIDY